MRTRASAGGAVRELERVLSGEYPALSFRVRTMDAQISDSIAHERAFALLCSLFSAVALCLAAIGIYGVLSYMIARRRREIGIRLALGASRAEVRRLIYMQSFTTCIIGATAGSILAFFAARMTTTMLYGIAESDLRTYVVAVSILGVVAIIATMVPALRASRTAPMDVLRCE
jgi:ABC-type antimicrobial peptide transport system permease subunit